MTDNEIAEHLKKLPYDVPPDVRPHHITSMVAALNSADAQLSTSNAHWILWRFYGRSSLQIQRAAVTVQTRSGNRPHLGGGELAHIHSHVFSNAL